MITLKETAQQQYKNYVDYMCLLTQDQPDNYNLDLHPGKYAIHHTQEGALLTDSKLRPFVRVLTAINSTLSRIIRHETN